MGSSAAVGWEGLAVWGCAVTSVSFAKLPDGSGGLWGGKTLDLKRRELRRRGLRKRLDRYSPKLPDLRLGLLLRTKSEECDHQRHAGEHQKHIPVV